MKNCEVNRPVSTKDLNNYFKIKDLLGGLTESQQAALRSNIGIKKWSGDVDIDVDIYHVGETPPEDESLLWISNMEQPADEINDSKILQKIIKKLNDLELLYSEISKLLSLGIIAGNSSIGTKTLLSESSEQINPFPNSTEPELENTKPDKLLYTVPNLSIKLDTIDNFNNNLNNLIDGELCFATDLLKLFIYYQGELISISTSKS